MLKEKIPIEAISCKGEICMAISSITKQFVIKDDETCKKLIDALNEDVPKIKPDISEYEEGKKLLVQLFGC